MKKQSLVVLLMLLFVFAMAGCKGSDGSNGLPGAKGADGATGATGSTGANGIDASTSADYTATITNASIATAGGFATATIDFTVQKVNGTAIAGITDADAQAPTKLAHLLINIAKLLPGVATTTAGTTPNTWWNVSSENVLANLTDHGNGLYTYVTGTMAISGATTTAAFYDSAAYTRVVLRVGPNNSAARSPLTWTWDMGHLDALGGGKDAKFDITNGSTITKDVVPTANCLKCHSTFGSEKLNPLAFHGGEGRVEVFACVVCHYENRGTMDLASIVSGVSYTFDSGEAEIGNFVHKIHTSQVAGGHDFTGVAYPQDIKNCTTCHNGGADSNNYKTKPSARACLSCHNPLNTSNAAIASYGSLTTSVTNHPGKQIVPVGLGLANTTDDTKCGGCHADTDIAGYHLSNWATTHNTGVVGAANFKYVISKVTMTTTGGGTQFMYPVITFQILNNGTPVNLATDFTGSALTGFVGSPTLGVAYAYTQDGITNPSDWNGRATASLAGLLSGTSGTVTGTTTMTAVLTGSTPTGGTAVPVGASLVTGLMYGTLTQSNWATVSTDTNGAIRPAIGALLTASSYTARRVIVDANRCNDCHEQLGTAPNFHGGPGLAAGPRNIPFCAACHTPNQGGNGWSASFRNFFHAIHAASKRTVVFYDDGQDINENFSDLEYPGVLSNCEQCHLPGTYDFSAPVYTDALINNMLLVTTATFTYDSTKSTAWEYSPYIQQSPPLAYPGYGNGYSFGVLTGGGVNTAPTVTEAAGTTLVSSPITAVCTACHDGSDAIAHIQTNGGSFYATRTDAKATPEQCLICHGPGRIAAIADVHKQ